MTNKTKQIEKAFEKLMTDMGATFVDVTPEKKQTDHNPDIVKKVDWDKRIEKLTDKYYIESYSEDIKPTPDYAYMLKDDIKQLLFKYGLWIIKAGEKEDQRKKNEEVLE